MARITVEDCTKKVSNRFGLVLYASERARGINNGAPTTIDRNKDKTTVTALREIAEGTINMEELKENFISSLQTLNKVDVVKDENLHAENQENMAEDADLTEDSMQILSHEDYQDLEIGDFEDEIIDGNK